MSLKKIHDILVIDDDPVLIKLLDEQLKKAGYAVTVAREAPLGLQFAMTNDYDVIILDVMMPIINGYNICKLLKTQEHKKHTPIILLTSRDQREDVQIGMDMGANAYLTKPVNIDELLRAMETVSQTHA